MPKMFSSGSINRGSLTATTTANNSRTPFFSPPGMRRAVASGNVNINVNSNEQRQSQPKSIKVPYKHCTKCCKKLPLSEFPKNSDSSDGYGAYCRECKNQLSKERRFKDATARFTHYIVSRINNEFPKEEIPKDIETHLETYLGYKLWELRKALRMDLALIGIRLTQSFKEGWHLDHVKPHSSFPKHKIGDKVFQACWAIENLKMIPATENLSKGAKNIETLTEIAQKAAKI